MIGGVGPHALHLRAVGSIVDTAATEMGITHEQVTSAASLHPMIIAVGSADVVPTLPFGVAELPGMARGSIWHCRTAACNFARNRMSGPVPAVSGLAKPRPSIEESPC